MKVGLIDVDAYSRRKVTFPNLSIMKISAWHKLHGDTVGWYEHGLLAQHKDIVYMSKVFGDEYSDDYPFEIDDDVIVKGGSGYAISVQGGKEVYTKELDPSLTEEVEHVFPDYGIYGIKDHAYGFLTRGCPRGCAFCHVEKMQGRRVRTVSRLWEFWNGEKNIHILDPNLTASKDYDMHMNDLAYSGAYVDFNQGLDIRLLTKEKIELLNRVNWRMIHFAWDNADEDLSEQFRTLKNNLRGCNRHNVTVYVLTNFGTTHEQDLERIEFLRSLEIQPYVMIYRKNTAPKETIQLQRYCNPVIFWSVPTFKDYKRK